ncbi:glycerol uptake facilitator protein [Lentzea sp. NBRC 105346]|uniref:MIP/aquaporin family protein n=1 Tax=Lentzea sp. NBRC 105346 TaxID=3032205 RepID=UPI0024A53974|nr:MIP/aquaporin family protein [Lentzea sp. NBRC 105346]GLZ34296.1 glycerol uptake facilitator protein [Lentzea sp. NBRC 105346]
MDHSHARKLAAELAGTTILCLFGISAAVAVSDSLLTVALAHGLALMVGIYAFGAVSGAHFNPTVTVALAVTGRLPWREVPGYVLAQLAGGVLGAYLAQVIHGPGTSLGATSFAPGVSVTQAFVAEALGAFLLVTAVFALAVSPSAPRHVTGLGIGLALATQIVAFGPVAGASVNLARTFGPDVVLAFTGGPVAWGQLPVYLIAPVFGGILAAGLFSAVTSSARRTANV